MLRYYFWLLMVIGLIIILIILLIPGGKKNLKPTLSSYASTDATASLTIDGPIIYNTDHQSIKITVGRDQVTYQQFNGYDGQLKMLQTYANTESAYSAFLHSLAGAGFTKGSVDNSSSDGLGFCPTGDRYIFQLNNDGSTLLNFWDTNCSAPKTYGGNLSLTLTLFRVQVPNYNDLIQQVNL